MSILDTVLRRREPAAAYRTIDGGHPAPYPDMTDEQLYNYEVAFNVPRKTFDRPPSPARAARHETRFEPEFESVAQESDATFDKPPAASTAQQEPGWRETEKMFDASASSASAGSAATEEPQSNGDDAAADIPLPPAHADQREVQRSLLNSSEAGPLDLTKPVRTVTTKQPVEIITTRARHPVYKVHGYIDNDDIVTVFTLDGQLSEHGARFLENVPEQHELYLNIYPNYNAYSKDRYVVTQHDTREEADAAASAERVACVRADFNL